MAWFRAHDPAVALEYLPRQAEARRARYPQLDHPRYEGAIQMIVPDGSIRSGADATATALTFLKGTHWRVLGRVLQLPGIRHCARIGYKWIAKNRHRFACDTDVCKR